MNEVTSRPSLNPLRLIPTRAKWIAGSALALSLLGGGTYVFWPKAKDYSVNADGEKQTAVVKIQQVRDLKNNVRKLIGSNGETVVVFGGAMKQPPAELVGKKLHVYVPLNTHPTYGDQYQINSPDQYDLEGKEKK